MSTTVTTRVTVTFSIAYVLIGAALALELLLLRDLSLRIALGAIGAGFFTLGMWGLLVVYVLPWWRPLRAAPTGSTVERAALVPISLLLLSCTLTGSAYAALAGIARTMVGAIGGALVALALYLLTRTLRSQPFG